MEDDRRKDDRMEIEPAEFRSRPSAAYGSPSYSLPELEECTDQNEKLKKDYEKAAEEDDGKRREGLCKAKRKVKAPSSEEEYDNDERKAARREAIACSSKHGRDSDEKERPDAFSRTTMPEPLISQPTAAEATGMDMDEYGAGYEMKFGDADAAMNESLSTPSTPSSSYNCEADNENDFSTTSAVRQPLAERRGLAKPGDLVTLQQQQARSGLGRGRGGGRGTGWGLEWTETVTQKMMDHQEWEYQDDPHPSPVEEDYQWEVYDEAAWDRAAERSKEPEAGKEAPKAPSAMRAEGSNTRATDSNRMTEMDLTRLGGDFVRAVTDYKAILRGTYLSYEKDDVMRVIYRDRDGRLTAYLGFAEIHVTDSWQGSSSTFSLSKIGPVVVGHIRRTSCLSLPRTRKCLVAKLAAGEWRERAVSMACDEACVSIVRKSESCTCDNNQRCFC